MTETFFIGDTHFGHKNILNFSGSKPSRSFPNIEEHDRELIRRWNGVVGKNDRIYHCGDFCFGKRNIELAAQLNGTKYLIMGNHDCYASSEYLKYFTKLGGAWQYENCIITHIPVHPQQLETRFAMNIHGHLHHEVLEDRRYYNVSCEQINLTPIPYSEIRKRLDERKNPS